MNVFVAGATGAIGRSLIPQLVEAGHQVTATLSGARGHATTTILHVEGQLLTNHHRPTGRCEEPVPWLTECEGLLMVHAVGEDFALFSESRKYCG